MAFILDTGSRRDSNTTYNPYSRTKSSLTYRIYTTLSPKTWCILFIIILIWFITLITVVEENPEIRNEVLTDIELEETIIKGKIKRGRLRAKEWIRHHILDDEDNIGPKDFSKQHEWDLSLLEDLALRTGPNDIAIHVIFSTDCSPYQHWQTYQFFLAALRTRQPGRVTQIASGCTTEEKQALKDWHKEHIAPLSLRFGLHTTPKFSEVKDKNGESKGEEYEFFNKPFGLQHFMEYANGMGIDPMTSMPWKHDTIIALLDPDQVLIKPITGYFESPNDIFRGGPLTGGANEDSKLSYEEKEPTFMVRHGHPASQEYGFSGEWMKFADVAGKDSPATTVSFTQAIRSYAVGPPYIATACKSCLCCFFVHTVHKNLH